MLSVADHLNQFGLTTSLGKPFDAHTVRALRYRHRLPDPDLAGVGRLTCAQAAERLGCAAAVLRYWISTGKLTAERSTTGRIAIPWDADVEAACRDLVAASPRLSRDQPPSPAP